MIQLDNLQELESLKGNGVKVILPMEAVTVKGIHNIYCPHCGRSVFDSLPQNRWEYGTCRHCGGKYMLYK